MGAQTSLLEPFLTILTYFAILFLVNYETFITKIYSMHFLSLYLQAKKKSLESINNFFQLWRLKLPNLNHF